MARAGRRRGEKERGVGGSAREDTPAAIVEATIAALADVGYGATSAREVASRAGVAPGGVFYHFGSMDDLLATVYERLMAERLDRFATVMQRPPAELPAALAAATRVEFRLPSSRALLEIVVGSIDSPTLSTKVREGTDASVTFTADALRVVAAGSPVAQAMPIELAAELAVAAFFGVEVLGKVGRSIDLDAVARLIELIAATLTPPA